MKPKELFSNFEKFIAGILVILMGFVVLSATLELGYTLVKHFIEPPGPGLFIGLKELLDLLGMFMLVLIAVELMASIFMYLEDRTVYLEMMFLIAITAMTRKIVTLDTKTIDPVSVIGLAAIIAALVGGYYVVKRQKPVST